MKNKKTTYISKNVFSLSIRTTEFIIGVTPEKIDKDDNKKKKKKKKVNESN